MVETKPAVGDDVDPDIREFHRRINRDYNRFSTNLDDSAASRRLVAEKVREPWRVGGPVMASVKELTVPSGVRIRVYTPAAVETGKVLIYLHGGGWTMFSLDTHDRLMREYAERANMIVVGVDYSLAPESTYPCALDDVTSVTEWIASGKLHQDNKRPAIFFGGDSAGANLAIAAAMRLRDEGKQNVDGLLLNYGAYDTEKRRSYGRFDGDTYMLTSTEMAGFWKAYLGEKTAADCTYARPMHVSPIGLSPVFMCIAERDILADENHAMAASLRTAGVNVTEKVYKGATHSFLEAVSISTLADRALDDAASWLRHQSPEV